MRRRYPELKLTSREIANPPGEKYFMTWDIVRENIDQYPIFVAPVLIERDNKLAEDFYFEPTRLVTRVSKTPDFDIARFASRSDQFLAGSWQDSFNLSWGKRPALEADILWQYLRFLIQIGSVYELNGFDGDSEQVFNQAITLADQISQKTLSREIRDQVRRAQFRSQEARLVAFGEL